MKKSKEKRYGKSKMVCVRFHVDEYENLKKKVKGGSISQFIRAKTLA